MKALLLALGIVVGVVICIVYSTGDSRQPSEPTGTEVQDSVQMRQKLKSFIHKQTGIRHT